MLSTFPYRRLVLLSGIVLAACHEAMPASPVEWPNPPATYPTTFLHGRVTEQGTNIPIAGAAVIRDTTQTLTNAEGYYNFTITDGFQIVLMVAKAGYDTSRVALALKGGDQVWDAKLTKQ